MNNPPK